jgi:hypothetical protein
VQIYCHNLRNAIPGGYGQWWRWVSQNFGGQKENAGVVTPALFAIVDFAGQKSALANS